jgi:hypothetical protein
MNGRLLFDTSILERQVKELKDCTRNFAADSAFSDELANKIERLLLDIDLGEAVSTVRADGAVEVCQRLRFGADFERLLTALRAGELDD